MVNSDVSFEELIHVRKTVGKETCLINTLHRRLTIAFMIRASLNVFMLASKSWWVGGGGHRIFRLHLFQTQTMRECSVYYNIDVE